jgi:glycoside/pentoside/hexuronide:cation symporter, GPH family
VSEQLTCRTKIGFGIGDFGGNMFFTIIGFSLLFYLTDVVRLAMGAIMGGGMMATAMITVASVREPTRTVRERSAAGFFKTCVHVLGMRVFLKALIPVWVAISKQIGKKQSDIMGMIIVSVGVLLFSFFGGEGRVVFAFIVMIGSGVGLSTHYVMPHSILPDVVEYDAVHNGVRREGSFSSMWTFASKVGQAPALLVTGLVLDLVRYAPDAMPQPITLTGIRLLCGPIPVVFCIVGIAVLIGYPISREYYDRMLAGTADEVSA